MSLFHQMIWFFCMKSLVMDINPWRMDECMHVTSTLLILPWVLFFPFLLPDTIRSQSVLWFTVYHAPSFIVVYSLRRPPRRGDQFVVPSAARFVSIQLICVSSFINRPINLLQAMAVQLKSCCSTLSLVAWLSRSRSRREGRSNEAQ